ncbi:hypothetical protein AHAS_Ahas11G0242900 [Arachis hypogaea]
MHVPHGEGTSRNPQPRRIQSEVHPPYEEEPPQTPKILGLVHGQRKRLEQLKQEAERQQEVEWELQREEESPLREEDPFVEEIMRAKVSRHFKTPDIVLYDRTSDPRHHLSNFKSRMYLADIFDATHCKAFPTTLTKAAMK